MFWFAVACLSAALATAISTIQLRRVGRDDGVASIVEVLKRNQVPASDGQPWAMVRAVLNAPSERAAVAELNEQLSDVERELVLGRDLPRAAARVSLATGTVCAVVELATSLPTKGGITPWFLGAFAIGGAGFLVILMIGREASARSSRRREAWNRASRELMRYREARAAGS